MLIADVFLLVGPPTIIGCLRGDGQGDHRVRAFTSAAAATLFRGRGVNESAAPSVFL